MNIITGEVVKSEIVTARSQFFWVLEKMAPEVLTSLAKDVLPQFNLAFRKKRIKHFYEIPSKNRPNSVRFRNALLDWSKRWNLNIEWALDIVIHILYSWWGASSRCGKIWHLPLDEPFIPIALDFPKVEPWEPWEETEEQFNLRVTDLVNSYKDKVLLKYFEQGFKPVPVRRYRKNIKPLYNQDESLLQSLEKLKHYRNIQSSDKLRHYEWLVRFHINKWKLVDIAQEYANKDPDNRFDVQEETIKKAIIRLARLIDLPLTN